MISLYDLFILLLTAEAIHAQGGKDGDDANQASGSNHNPKQDTGLPLRVHPIDLSGFLRRVEAPDQNGASSSVDPQLGNGSKVPRWLRNLFGSSTSDDSPQSNKMPLPAYAGKAEVESYSKNWETDQYREFIAGETEYFTSEYLIEKEIGTGSFGIVYLATKKYNGMKVAYKSIPKSKIRKYALEPNPPPICNLRNPLVGSDEQSVAQCMSSRPPNLPFPYEVLLQTYLSRPGRENPYVPTTFDYIALEGGYILLMEYLDEKWIALSSYAKKKRRLDIEEARNIIKEIVNAMISLKQNGVLHGDLNADNVMYNKETNQVKLIDFGISAILPGWDEGKLVPLKSSDPPSPGLRYEAEADELRKHCYSTHPFANLVVECEQVTGHRIQSGLLPAIQKSRLRLLGRALDPGVENVYTWLRGGVLNGEADLDQRWLDGTVEQ
ncbi:hypothetical protein BASA50_004394 [Batrachochytrium salamandrivorans]|uniref:non-specific serine/threonine protein kinase n=1 Tax=Batrachochytrium salamandrivorans TaxID=1357716 RepID=A0ABQ8FFN0_9FUNG|nr:hypothetical protein BASA50_004394 [Batrachochytrium salamandrivorans]